MSTQILTKEMLVDVLNYDKNTGIFTWIKRDFKKSLIGKQAGTIRQHGYLCIRINNILFYSHRLAWLYEYGEMPKGNIDHINGDKLDNRIENLRDVTQKTNVENVLNARKHNKSGILGVSILKNKYIFARIRFNNKQLHLGYFDTVEEAHQAYLKAKRGLHNGCTI